MNYCLIIKSPEFKINFTIFFTYKKKTILKTNKLTLKLYSFLLHEGLDYLCMKKRNNGIINYNLDNTALFV